MFHMKELLPDIVSASLDSLSERQSEIAELVRTNGFASIDELSVRFSVSTQTIRKDVNGLCDQGLLRRVHGGVQLSSHGNLEYKMRRVLRIGAKRQIGAAVAETVPNGSSLSVSIGTTPETVVTALLGHSNLKILTNNLNIAMVANSAGTFDVSIPGGLIRQGDGDIVGPTAVSFFESYKADFGIFGVAAVDADGGLLDFYEEEVAARQAILQNCRKALLVVDFMKFERNAHVRGGHITDVGHVFCDQRPPPMIETKLKEAGVPLTICGKDTA